MSQSSQMRTYDPAESVVFFKTRERFGGLSNMAAGFPLNVNDVPIRTSEALYQACRFPHKPDVQRRIVAERSPMTAKMRGKPFRNQSRPDWTRVRVNIMRWCLRVKLAQNLKEFGNLLLVTGDRPIVERSRKDDYWGAKTTGDGTLTGMNVLGRLLMELRNELKSEGSERFMAVEPLSIPDFRLFGTQIGRLDTEALERPVEKAGLQPTYSVPPQSGYAQRDLLEQSDRYFSGSSSARIAAASRRGRRGVEGEPDRERATVVGSGVNHHARSPWQPCVSSGWHETQVKRAFSITLGKMLQNTPLSTEDTEVPYLKAQHIQWNDVITSDLPTMWASPEEIDTLCVRPGDLLVCEGGEVGRASILSKFPPDSTIIQNALHLVRGHKGASSRFLAYLLIHASDQDWFAVICNKSTITHFTVEKFRDMWVWLPDISQQRAIADCLDRETAQMDALVAAKERLLDLLTEKRQALVTCAVTGCLDPEAVMCERGTSTEGANCAAVRVKGEVCAAVSPAQRKLKYVASVNDEVLEEDTDPDFNILYVDIGNVDSSGRIGEIAAYRFEDSPSRARRRVRDGDVIISTVRTYLQAITQVQNPPDNMIVSTGFAVVRPLSEFDTNYCKYVLREQGFLAEIEKRSVGVSYPAINAIDLANIPIHIYPLARQRTIVDYLDRETARLDELVGRTRETVALLRERRAALISAAVSGKGGGGMATA